MNKAHERIKMVKAMEFIARHVNDEEVFEGWLTAGVADGDIEFGDLSTDMGDVEWYTEGKNFKDLMDRFLKLMVSANESGGLYCK